ncbi:MAG: RecB family exonuclease, partial [Fusobacteriaceae bacterium]
MEERKLKIYNMIRNEVKSRGKKVEFLSFSKLEKFLKCKRAYRYQYIDKFKVEFKDNLHADIGTVCHDLIEWSTTEKWGQEKLMDAFKIKSKGVCGKYGMKEDIPLIKSTKHFFEESKFIKELQARDVELEFEAPIYHKLRFEGEDKELEYWFVGFVDLIVHNEDGTISIVDFKTSNTSGYVGKKLQQAFVQIYSYAYIYESMHREKRVRDVGYLFIKYCNLTFKDTKGKGRKSSKVERRNIQEDYETKNGDSDLIITDCYDIYDYNKDNRLVYMQRLVEVFHETKTEGMFDGKGRDEYYCKNF